MVLGGVGGRWAQKPNYKVSEYFCDRAELWFVPLSMPISKSFNGLWC